MHTTILNLPESERPYEKFLNGGAETLSDAELLAVVIKNGTKELTSMEVAREILKGKQGNLLNLYEYSYEELCSFPGIGRVKAIQLKSIAELSRRISVTRRGYTLQMNNPESIADYYMEQMRHLRQEILMAAFFDAKCTYLGDSVISKGSVTYAYVSPKDIFRNALQKNAVLIVLLHNHPSGDPAPSREDIEITKRIRDSGILLDIQLADHIIIGDNSYYSMKENLLI